MKLFQAIRFFLLTLLFCSQLNSYTQNKAVYLQEISNWDNARASYQLSADGWVNLEGLYWLKQGNNYFGSGVENELVFKYPSFPRIAGNFLLDNQTVRWISHPHSAVTLHDSLITEMVIFEEKQPVPLLALGSFRWNIIKREDKIGVRFRDLESPRLKQFKGIQRFNVNEDWRVVAHLEKGPEPSVLITNVLGQINAESTPGKLVFTLSGNTYKLDAITEGDQLFILFGDATSGKETYPTGRFLYTKLPDENGNTILDFNKAFNPPCAFTGYATCPIPPKQNILPIAVTAGEKEYVFDGHTH